MPVARSYLRRVLTLALAVALAQTPQHRLFQQPNLPQSTGEAAAFFEFAPTSGAGMGAVCACTTPTGAKGETLTYTRASNGTCTKTATGGLATTGIANGDLVVCSTNQPRVEYDGAGYLGLLVESARTNSTLRSEELDNAAWASNNSGIALPTVTANAATAPDGTLTAERVQIPGSTTGGHYSQLYQLNACPGGAAAQIGSYYIKGVSGSGSICFKIGTAFQNCSYVSGSWTRCMPTINAAASLTLTFAVDVTACGSNAAGVDAYVWGVQCENSGAYQTSYIPTTSATVTRAGGAGGFNLAGFDGSAAGSMAVTLGYPSGAAWEGVPVQDSAALNLSTAVNATGRLTYLVNGTTFGAFGGGPAATQTVDYTGTHRLGTYWTTTAVTSIFDATTAAGTWTAPLNTQNVLQVGSYSGVRSINTIASRVCLDQSATRCR